MIVITITHILGGLLLLSPAGQIPAFAKLKRDSSVYTNGLPFKQAQQLCIYIYIYIDVIRI